MVNNSARQPRQTRSSAACDSCRSKKQKCGGEWPVCARCRETGNPCVWPQQLQRGPAKGYLEAIEARLDNVESILLQVLPLLPTEQLLNTITCQSESIASPGESTQKRTTQEKRAALEYWSSFPLNSPRAVLAWAQDRQRRSGSPKKNQSGGSQAPMDLHPSNLADYTSGSPNTSTPFANPEVTAPDINRRQPNPSGSTPPNWHPCQVPFGGQDSRAGVGTSDIPNMSATIRPPDHTPHTVQPNTPASLSRSSSTHTYRVDLSEEFRSKFLW